MIIGVVGKSGSGKNVVSEHLVSLGFDHYDLDVIGHKCLNENVEQLQEYFGDTIVTSEGTIDRKVLGNLVFNDRQKLILLESFITPKIESFVSENAFNTSHNVVLNGATLYKSNLRAICDVVIWVDASLLTRLYRLTRRDKQHTLYQIILRMWNQRTLTCGQYDSPHILKNNGNDVKNDISEIIELYE